MARKHRLPIAYVNQFGGNDDLVFDGRSTRLRRRRRGDRPRPLVRRRRRRLRRRGRGGRSAPAADLDVESEIWRALVLGTRDYVRKCGFTSVVLGLSGGIDSALTAAIAVDALGADHVLGVLMPSPYSSQGSIDDARELAANLGIETMTLPIEPLMRDVRRHAARGARRRSAAASPRKTSRRASAATC